MNQKRTLRAEVISIGDELTSGARLDTNGQWLSQRLGELGLAVAFHSTVGDTLADNVDVFRNAANRADIIVSTGGLGPTRDDLTREALATVAGVDLVRCDESLAHIRMLFDRRGREMPPRNEIQAMFPQGSRAVFNPQGTAPGVELRLVVGDHESTVFALPGVPAEMKRMFVETVKPRIAEITGSQQHIEQSVMKFFGIGESDMESRLGDMIARDRHPRVGITVSAATISLRITANGDDPKECQRVIADTRQEILNRVGDLHFGDGETFEQQHAVANALGERDQSMVVVEFGHAAPLNDWFASLGNRDLYRGGLSFVSTDDLMESTRSDSLHDALLSLGSHHQSDWILSVDQYPPLEREADTPMSPVEVQLSVVTPEGKRYPTKTTLGGHPDILQQRIAKTALAWFRKVIAGYQVN